MSTRPISFAKTTRPSFSGVLPRERLFAALDAARKSPVVWITGPPGCGKTTLAASYIEQRKLASLWYQIDESDTDVASFFYHLGLAAEQAKRKPVRLPKLTPEHHQALPAFTRRYFQALYGSLGASFAIVFDGYHELSPQSPLHEVMQFALSEIPPGGSVLLISRSDPPAAMARLRANRALEVVGWRELRLTQDESDEIAARRGQTLPREALNELYEKTQGWAAGLVLLLEQSSDDLIAAPADLATPQLVFDYLAGEIFQKADSGTRELLLRTAYLPQMTADMARSVSGQEDAGERLENLYRNNYFVTLKQARPQPVYEYHPLLREFVLSRVNAMMSKEQRLQLQRAAAELLEAEGLVAESALLLRASGDWERTGMLVRRHARAMLDSGRSATLAQWIESLPKEEQERNPWLLYWLAVARVHISPRESRLLHERGYDLFCRQAEPDLRGLLFTCSGAMDAILYEVDDFSLLDRWIDTMDRLLREHPDLISGAIEARVTCSLFTSMVVRQPHHPEIQYWGERAYRASLAQPDVSVRMSVEPRVALGIAYGGHFPKAWAVIEGIRSLVAAHDVPPPALTMLKLVEATYFMLTAQREQCLAAVRDGLDIERAEGINVFSHQLLAYGAGGALASDDLATAEDFLRQSSALPEKPARFDLCLHHLFSTWLAMRRNDAVRAFQQQKLALRMAIEVGCPVFEVLCRIASAQVLYEAKEPRAAFDQFQQVYGVARHIRNHLLEFTGLMNYAYVALDSGRRPRSGMRALRQALAVGKPRNYLSVPLLCPQPLARLCSIALEHDIEPAFVARLIRGRGLALDACASALLDWPWPLRVNALGQFRVLKNGEPISFTGKAQRRPFDLLKVVIAYGGREVSEERVTEALWPRIDGDSAHRSFTTTLHRLRKLLGEDRAITLSEGKLTLDGRHVWLDVWAFDQAVTRINQALRAPPDQDTAGALRELAERLLGLYAGPFLGTEPETAWCLALRDRLRHRFVRTLGDVCHRLQQNGRLQDGVDLLERALELDPAPEGLYRNLMLCYAQLGRRAEAVDTYERCRRLLAATLSTLPAPETTAIFERL